MSSAVQENERIVETIRSSLVRSLGDSPAKAFEFYFDPTIALEDPDRYEKMLQNTFLAGAQSLINLVVDALCSAFGVGRPADRSLGACIRAVRSASRRGG